MKKKEPLQILEITNQRKRGRPLGSGKGRKSVTRSICLSILDWDRLDDQRGSLSRGEWIRSKMQ